MHHQDDEAHNLFITGVKNAHAMEKQALAIMQPQVSRLESYPDVKSRLTQHIRETEGQIERLDRILSSHGSDASGLKDTMLSAAGLMAALGHSAAPDEILKNSFANFAFENFEIAAYTSLITLAEVSGDQQSMMLLNQNLSEEQEMAAWLKSNLTNVTQTYLARREAGVKAKV
jgi:ferritin-like metal-binding protein YciE